MRGSCRGVGLRQANGVASNPARGAVSGRMDIEPLQSPTAATQPWPQMRPSSLFPPCSGPHTRWGGGGCQRRRTGRCLQQQQHDCRPTHPSVSHHHSPPTRVLAVGFVSAVHSTGCSMACKGMRGSGHVAGRLAPRSRVHTGPCHSHSRQARGQARASVCLSASHTCWRLPGCCWIGPAPLQVAMRKGR